MRIELKYYMGIQEAFLLHKLLSCYCSSDRHHKGQYLVESLYYDTVDNQSMFEKLEGHKSIGKIRVRRYNASGYKLEYKYKKGDCVFKKSIDINETFLDQFSRNPYMIGDYFPRLKGRRLHPKTVVRYTRQALEYSNHIRFTFDHALAASTNAQPDLRRHNLMAVVKNEQVIFEIKYNDYIPIHLKRILSDFGLKSSISKYVLTRTEI